MRIAHSLLARVQLSTLAIGMLFGPFLSFAPVFVPLASAASSGPNNGTTFVDDNGTGTIAWTNPDRAQSSDDSRARASLTSGNRRSHYLQATGFGFSIPAGSTIDGIVVDVEHSSNVADLIRMRNVQMIKGGSRTGTAFDGTSDPYTWPTTDTVTTYGSATDLWGTTWTAADVNAADFGVALVAQHDSSGAAANARVDQILLTVYYTLPATTTVVTSSANPSTYGDSVTFTATVTGTAPTGSVEFFDGVTSLGTVALAGATASLSLSTLAAATHSITAVYGGDGGNSGSTSAVLSQVVNKSTLTVTADNASREYGEANPGFTASFAGFVNGEVLATSGVTGAPSLTTLAVPTSPAPGPYTITAALGTLAASNYDFSFTDGALTVTPATLTVSADSTSRVYGDPNPAFTASYSGFKNGEILGTSDVTGSPSLTTLATPSSSVPGPYTITAAAGTLASGNYSFTFVDGLLTITAASTNTSTVFSAPNSSIVGDPVTLTGSVTGGLDPTGTIDFYDGAVLIGSAAVASGNASISYTFTTVGSHSLTAIYSGDANHTGSTGGATTQVVDKASPATSTVLSAPNSSIVGDPVTLTGSVTGGFGPTGSLEFFDGATSLGTVALSGGSASLTWTFTTVGTHNLTAVYGGDANNNGSTSPTATVQVVDKASPVTTTVLNAPATSVVGDMVTLTVTVTGGYNPTGVVNFMSGSFLLWDTVPLIAGTATLTLSFDVVGTYTLSAEYSGDANNNASTSALTTLQVVIKASPTTTTVLNLPSTSVVGDAVSLSATVTGGYGPPTGSVEFLSGSTVLGTATLVGDTATLSHTFTVVGDYSLTAHYLGDASNNDSSSAISTLQVVNKALPSTSTAIGVPNSSIIGDTVTFTASVSGGFNPTGVVNFMEGVTVLGSGTLLAGSATFSTAALTVGNHSIHAEYLGDASNLGSSSPSAVIQVVDKFQSSTSIDLPVNLSYVGDSITLGTVVTGFFPTGTVTFRESGTDLGSITLGNGSGSFVVSSLTEGTHVFDAVYGGDINNIGSTSSGVTLVVVVAPPQNGGTRGHNVTGYSNVVHFVLAGGGGGGGGRNNNSVAPGAFGGQGDNVIIPRQREMLCILQKAIARRADNSLVIWLAQYLAPFFSLQSSVIEVALQDPALCSGITASAPARLTVSSVQQIMPVDGKGVPVSTNEIWNRCIRNSISISATDLEPMSCQRYHEGHYWKHPDSGITFFWSDRYRQQLISADRQPLLTLRVK